jgi:splicing factor 3B subunit 4
LDESSTLQRFDRFLFYDDDAHPTHNNTSQVAREVDSGISRGYGFVSFDSFDSADAAIEAMNNRFLSNKPVQVSYAMKRDGKGELHGSGAGMICIMIVL